MEVSSEIECLHGSIIQIAKVSDGGNSSWGKKKGVEEDSIRLAWYNKYGGFDPYSSAELPLWGLKEIIQAAAQNDMFSIDDLKKIIVSLTASIERQS